MAWLVIDTANGVIDGYYDKKSYADLVSAHICDTGLVVEVGDDAPPIGNEAFNRWNDAVRERDQHEDHA